MTSRRPASLARRALPALVLTGTSLALLTRIDRPAASTDLLADPAAPATPQDAAAATTTPPPTALAPSAPTTTGGRSAPTTAAAPSTPGSTVPAAPTCTGQAVTGPVASTRWGPVQVAATVSAQGQVCDVQVLQYPTDDRKSRAINQRALPVLRQRALADGADFDAVSGATVTSEGYRASLQAILDRG